MALYLQGSSNTVPQTRTNGPLGAKCQLSSQMKSQLPVSKSVKHCLDFSSVFSAPLHEETCFQQAGSSAVEGTSQAVLESSDQRDGTSQPVTISEK